MCANPTASSIPGIDVAMRLASSGDTSSGGSSCAIILFAISVGSISSAYSCEKRDNFVAVCCERPSSPTSPPPPPLHEIFSPNASDKLCAGSVEMMRIFSSDPRATASECRATAKAQLVVVFPTPPLPPTKIHLSDCCSTTFRSELSIKSSSSSPTADALTFEDRGVTSLAAYAESISSPRISPENRGISVRWKSSAYNSYNCSTYFLCIAIRASNNATASCDDAEPFPLEPLVDGTSRS
mmetsp:Transcript_15451/g.33299  ORF Transcript_15451/g.33299 Transcript_15451/m.33299 type:complete len:240 (+) Transcript_15451:2045-2764(+)